MHFGHPHQQIITKKINYYNDVHTNIFYNFDVSTTYLFLCTNRDSTASNNITATGIAELCFAKWDNLAYLDLNYNKIGNIGCKYLSRLSLNNLKQLNLGHHIFS